MVRRDEIGSFVECHSCASTFDVGVLTQPSEGPVEDMLTRTLRRAAGALLSPTELSDEDRAKPSSFCNDTPTSPMGLRTCGVT